MQEQYSGPAKVFHGEAEKLERRARAYRVIAQMIEANEETLTEAEVEDLFALRCYIG